jgi:hypothetical protein
MLLRQRILPVPEEHDANRLQTGHSTMTTHAEARMASMPNCTYEIRQISTRVGRTIELTLSRIGERPQLAGARPIAVILEIGRSALRSTIREDRTGAAWTMKPCQQRPTPSWPPRRMNSRNVWETIMETCVNFNNGWVPWNKGKLLGQKAPLRLKEIWAIRIRLELAGRMRELALFNLAIDSKLRACDLTALRVRDVCMESGCCHAQPSCSRKRGDRCSSNSPRPPATASGRGLPPRSWHLAISCFRAA